MKLHRELHRYSRLACGGYVALEFVVAMGLLVLPTAMIVLQIPGYLERHDRVQGLTAAVARQCANQADVVGDGDTIARQSALDEMDSSAVLRSATLVSATCTFSSSTLNPGSVVTAEVSVAVPAPVVPGLPSEVTWTLHSKHVSVIPQYRSFGGP
jgi:hypothetical protein